MKKNNEYPFDLDDIDKLGCEWNWVSSQRSTGKTYQVLVKGFRDFIKSGEVDQIAIVRRWDSDWKTNTGMKSCYNSLIINGNGENMIDKLSHGKYDGVEYKSGVFYLTKYDEKTNQVKQYYDKIIAYGFSLNLAERVKGGSFPRIHRILIDEACTTAGYLKNEFSAMQSIVSTIIRNRTDCKVYLMANTVDFYCPTFDDFGLTEGLKTLKQGDTKIFTYSNGMKVSFTWLDVNCKLDKPVESSIFFGFENAASKMITEGAWEIPEYPHLPYDIDIHPSEVIYTFFVQFKGTILQCEIVDQDGNMFTFIHKKTGDIKYPDEDLVFTDDPSMAYKKNYFYGMKNLPHHKILDRVLDVLATYPVYFDTNTTGYVYDSFNQVA